MISISAFLNLLCLIIGAGSYPNAICVNSTEEMDEDDPFCVILGAIFVVSSLMAACFWCSLSFHLALTITFGLNELEAANFKWPLFISSLMLPLVLLIVALSLGEFSGGGGELPICFLAHLGSNDDIYLYFIPLMVILGIGLICNCLVFYRFIFTRIQMLKSRTHSVSREIQDLKLVLFLILYVIVLGVPVAARLQSLVRQDEIRQGMNYWLQCNIEHLVTQTADGQVNNPTQNELCQVMNHHFPDVLSIITYLLQSLIGIAFGCFFLGQENLLWLQSLGLFVFGRKEFPREHSFRPSSSK